jgi:hypothetical protein
MDSHQGDRLASDWHRVGLAALGGADVLKEVGTDDEQ